MAINGVFASNQGMVGDAKTDFSSVLLQQFPTGTAMLLAISSGMDSEDVDQPLIEWFEESKITGQTDVVSGGTTTTVVVVDGSSFVPNTILKVDATGEMMIVTAQNGNSLTVTRGVSGTSIVSIDGTDSVTRTGSAVEEGSDKPVAVLNQGKARTNYLQIFRNTWAVTRTAKRSTFQTGNKEAKSRREAGMFHAEDIERSFLWGKKNLGSRNGKPFRMMDGLEQQIRIGGGVLKTQGASFKLNDFRDWLRQIFENNVRDQPNERIAFCGNIVLQIMNEAANLDSQYHITVKQTEFGLNFSTFVCPFGTINLLTHPLFNENSLYREQLWVLHPGAIKTWWLSRTFWDNQDKNGSRDNGRDGDEGVVTSEVTISCGLPATMGIFDEINGPPAVSS